MDYMYFLRKIQDKKHRGCNLPFRNCSWTNCQIETLIGCAMMPPIEEDGEDGENYA